MKSKKLFLLVLLTVGVVFFLTSNVGAAPGWYFADVIRVGANTVPSVAIQITDTAATPAFTEAWCTLDASNAKTMLATALTVLSLGKTVYVNMDPTLPVPNVTALYINE